MRGAGAAAVVGALVGAVLAAQGDARPCVMPAYGGHARTCKSDLDCCGENKCVDAVCATDASLNSVETALLAHMLVENSMGEVAMLHDALDKAAQALAVAGDKVKNATKTAAHKVKHAAETASDKVKEAAGKASDKVKDAAGKAADKTADAADAVSKKAHELKDKAEAKAHEAKMSAKEKAAKTKEDMDAKAADAAAKVGPKLKGAAAKADEAGKKVHEKAKEAHDKAAKTLKEVKAVFDEILHNLIVKADAVSALEFKAATGGASDGYSQYFSKYMGGAGGSPDGSAAKGDKHSRRRHRKGKKDSSDADDAGASAGAGAGGAGGFDFQKFVPGGSGTPKNAAASPDDKMGGAFDYTKYSGSAASKPKNAAAKAGADAAPGSFDYSKYMGGAAKPKNAAAASPSSFDYSKFTGGAGGAGASAGGADKKSKKKDKKGADKTPAAGAFDYSKFMGAPSSKLVNSAAAAGGAGGAGAGFDWSKFVPEGVNATKGDAKTAKSHKSKKPASNKPAEVPPPAAESQGAGEPKPGEAGSPCGKTPYKDFGPCLKNLMCETHKAFTAYAPGKCVEKPSASKTKQERPAVNSAEMETPATGGLDGACGKWDLGKVDFGACAAGLTCVASDDVMIKFMGATYVLPSTCQNVTGDGEPAETEDVETVDEPTAMLVNNAKAHHDMDPKELADAANALALKAAEAADRVAEKLKATAAKLRESAEKLRKEAEEKLDKNTADKGSLTATSAAADASSVLLGDAGARGGSHWVLFSFVALLVGGAAYAWRSSSKSQYRRL